LAGALYGIGLFLFSLEIRDLNSSYNSIAALFIITGSILSLLPVVFNFKLFLKPLESWMIFGSINILIHIFLFFFEVSLGIKAIKYMFLTIPNLILLISFQIILIRTIGKHTSAELSNKSQDNLNLLSQTPLTYILKAIKKERQDEIYKIISKNMDDLIFLLDRDLNILYINDYISRKITGYSKRDLISKNLEGFIYEEDKYILQKIFREKINKEKISAEIRFIKKDYTLIWLEFNFNLIKLNNSDIRILGIGRDITKNIKIRKKIEEENARLKELNDFKDRFLALATHEVKNPLTTLLLAVDMLKNRLIEGDLENSLNLIEKIQMNVSNLRSLTSNLLDFAMFEIQKFRLNKKELNLTEIISLCITSEKLRAEEKNCEIIVNLPEKIMIFGDRINLIHVFLNLIINAINYIPEGRKGKIIISSKIKRKENKVIISIKDNGIGIHKNNINKLFKLGTDINKDGKKVVKGSGIGLYIAKQIIDAHGGKIWAESEGIDQGATFFVEFNLNN